MSLNGCIICEKYLILQVFVNPHHAASPTICQTNEVGITEQMNSHCKN